MVNFEEYKRQLLSEDEPEKEEVEIIDKEVSGDISILVTATDLEELTNGDLFTKGIDDKTEKVYDVYLVMEWKEAITHG